MSDKVLQKTTGDTQYGAEPDWGMVEEQAEEIIAPHRGDPGALIEVLHQVQEIVGYLPMRLQVLVAEGLGVSVSDVYSVVTFYSLFSLKPKGKYHISICKGTACYVRGALAVIDRLEGELGIKVGDTTDDRKFSLEVVRCLGACGLGPVATVNDQVYARITPDMVPQMLMQE